MVSGSMGDVTFRVCGGRQVMSSRVRRTTNPRTLPQMLQRVRFPNLVATYRAFRGGMKDCFERTGVAERRQPIPAYNRFIGANLQSLPVYLTREEAEAGGCVVAPYLVAEGSLPAIGARLSGGNVCTDVALGGLELSGATTVGGFAEAVVAGNPLFEYGDRIVFFKVLQLPAGADAPACIRVSREEVVLDAADGSLLWEGRSADGFRTVGGALGCVGGEGWGACAYVHIREGSEGRLVSSQRLVVSSPLTEAYTSSRARNRALSSYGCKLVPLEPGGGEGVAEGRAASFSEAGAGEKDSGAVFCVSLPPKPINDKDMNKTLMAAGLAVVLGACDASKKADGAGDAVANPFFAEYATPFGVPPFEQIKVEHYKPAFLKGMEQQVAEVAAIVDNPDEATFENTIAALDRSGELLTKVSYAFGGQASVNTNDEIQALEQELSPLLSRHSDDISLNPKLFARVKSVYENQSRLNLDKEQKKLLEETYKGFVRGGANLDEDKQAELRKLNEQISMLELTFGQNSLKETNAFRLVIDRKEDLSGLPETSVAAAAATAREAGMEGKWVFTLHNPSVMPFLQYADNRALREQIYKAYISRGNNNNANDNKEVIAKLVAARLAKAKLLGYEDYAAYVLEENMAKNEKNVYDLLDKIWTPALAKAKEELADINAAIKKEGGAFEAEAWDWRYYFEKAKKAKFDLDENEIRPYLELNQVREGAFFVANKLYGITFTSLQSMPLPDPDAQVFECKDQDGTTLGVLYMDFFTRPGKGGGAWCGGYRDQAYRDGKRVVPIVTTVFNFSKPAEGQPALLSADEAETVFHEFGHALNALFADVHYQGVSGVPRDFVELPSQVMEHWVFEPEVLKVYAKHHETGEVIPQPLVDKIIKSGKYGQGFATAEYVAASLLDMDYHVLKEIPAGFDVESFEAKAMEGRGLIRQIPPRYRSTYFGHTMEGGYTAGYYSYIWAEVLDCDAFEAFKETGNIFNPEVAAKFRTYVLSPGGIDEGMVMYRNFRGQDPSIDPLLENRGLR